MDAEEAGRRGIEVLGLFDLETADGDRQDALRMTLEGRTVLGKVLLVP
ncbi:hypothetical protein [Nocardiopsis synnemataformans]